MNVACGRTRSGGWALERELLERRYQSNHDDSVKVYGLR